MFVVHVFKGTVCYVLLSLLSFNVLMSTSVVEWQ